jgi:hypothetical protein
MNASFGNRRLGTLAMVCAPFLLFELLHHVVSGDAAHPRNTPVDGWLGLVYLVGLAASDLGLYRLRAAGTGGFGRVMPWVLLTLVTMAALHSGYLIVAPAQSVALFEAFDAAWPFSHLALMVFGLGVARAGRLPGWSRFAPLVVGMRMFPLTSLLLWLAGRGTVLFVVVGVYSALACLWLGNVIRTSEPPRATA